MSRKAKNTVLQKAEKSKSDEFYTQLCDIERELVHYQNCFENKVVYCNCDDPKTSNFYRYFIDNFRELRLRKVIAARYKKSNNDLFSTRDNTEHGYYCEYSAENCTKSLEERIIHFKGDGDFRSKESIELLKSADIVVTNPPFSLFRDFVAQLVRYDKKFLVIGNINAITYKEIFDLIQRDKVWLGLNLGRGISGFVVPKHYELYGTEVTRNEHGEPVIATNNCMWLTNLELEQRHQVLELPKQFAGNEDKYPVYDNCNGINVNKTQDIPNDYEGLIGVPITFLHKYNPDQFEIVRFRKGDDGKDLSIKGKCPYFRILVRNKSCSIQ